MTQSKEIEFEVIPNSNGPAIFHERNGKLIAQDGRVAEIRHDLSRMHWQIVGPETTVLFSLNELVFAAADVVFEVKR